MNIDFARFAQLTCALAAASCDRPPPAVPPHVATPPEEPVPAAAPSEPGRPSEPTPTTPPEASETPADLSRCAVLSASCEGLREECQTLAGQGDPSSEGFYPGFRPRVAEEIATCWAANLSPPKCRPPAMGKCIRDAVMRSTVDPATVAQCDELMASCASSSTRARYTREQCQRALSSVSGRTREDAARVMGPSGEGGCSLEYALPYYPFGQSW